MANVFNWIRPGYELVKENFEWTVQVPFLHTTDGSGKQINSPLFPLSQETKKWKLCLYDDVKKLSMSAWHCNSVGLNTNIVEPVLVKISILNENGCKVFQQMLPSESKPNCRHVEFSVSKENIIKSQCQQANNSYTFCCKILTHVKLESVLPSNPPDLAIDCSGELIAQLEELFQDMKFSDVIFNVGGREFPAHKSILAARSEVFAAMFQHPTKENLTNQIEIEDIEPEVFQELIRFVYTGRLKSTTMETMAVGLLFAGDKYLLIQLRNECEKYLLRQMSPANCVQLILHGDMLNPADHLKEAMKEAAKFFRRLQSEVMATAKWEKMEEENPQLLFKIQKLLLSKK